MTEKLLVVADSGRFKAYRFEDSPSFSSPRLQLLEDWETGVAQHLSEQVTDQGGQYRKGRAAGGTSNSQSDGEQHNLDLERRSRAVRRIAERVNELIEQEQTLECYLALDGRLNQAVLDKMNRNVRDKLKRNVVADLSKLTPSEIIDYFGFDKQPAPTR